MKPYGTKRPLFALLLLIGIIIVGVNCISLPQHCFKPIGDCNFYKECLEPLLPCGPKGYAISYGFKYCSKFQKAPFASQYAKDWIPSTTKCLQESLVPVIKDLYFRKKSYTCENITEIAFNSHPKCYTQPKHNVCKFPVRDFVKVPLVVDAKDYLSIRSLKQTMAVLKTCGKLLLTK